MMIVVLPILENGHPPILLAERHGSDHFLTDRYFVRTRQVSTGQMFLPSGSAYAPACTPVTTTIEQPGSPNDFGRSILDSSSILREGI